MEEKREDRFIAHGVWEMVSKAICGRAIEFCICSLREGYCVDRLGEDCSMGNQNEM